MTSPARAGRVLPMQLSPGHDDRVSHTLKHFLRVEERWEALEPRAALAPQAVLTLMATRGWAVPARDRTQKNDFALDENWWTGPKGDVVRDAHDRGYFPRYERMAVEAGPATASNPRWVFRHDGRCYTESLGYQLVARPQRGGLLVITALRSGVLKDSSDDVGLATLGELLKAKCQRIDGGRSPEGGGLPRTETVKADE